MKCDELKSLKNIALSFDTTTLHKQVIAEDSEGNCYGFDSWEEVYLKYEADAAIAELKQKLEDAKATAYAESVDVGMENRKLKRSLWLARAERESDKARIFYFAETCGVKLNIDGYSNKEKEHSRMCTSRWWRLTWLKVERKCRAKAEEYK